MQVTVLGAGNMGHGIAQVSAMAGHEVIIRDLTSEEVDRGIAAIRENLTGGIDRGKLSEADRAETLANITGTSELVDALDEADIVVEAVPEDLSLKQETLAAVGAEAPTDAVIATNTSSLSVTEIMNALERPERGIGLHFFNPVHLMDLVEIVLAEQTTTETLAFATDFVNDICRTPIEVNDSPGFASSRLGVALSAEAMRMVETGVAPPNDIDSAIELGYGHPMGPLELTDVVGLDVRLDILEYLRAELGERFRPPQILKRKVRAGKLGRKSGEGFYVWEDGEKVEAIQEVADLP